MRTIIAGSRQLSGLHYVEAAVAASGFNISLVLSGCARGPDSEGFRWAEAKGITVEPYPANWDGGRNMGAGYARNIEMAEKAEALIAIWDGVSDGTRHMIEQALLRKLKVFILFVSNEPAEVAEQFPDVPALVYSAKK